ncbi:MAG: hypothetical protein JWR66_2498 [Modestobacter sp.]|nr:hypothetical protein [Modestobacter sp.]
MRGRTRTVTARLVTIVLGLALAATAAVVADRAATPTALTPAADIRQFDPGNIITDDLFFDGGAMSAAEVQAFITTKGASCRTGTDGTPCLKDFRQDTTARAADAYCAGYTPGAAEPAGLIIAKIGISCGISQRALLVILQKEQGLVTSTGGANLYATRYQKAMGFACPDTAPCDVAYYGFQNQVYSAARQFQRYAASPASFGYRAGRTSNIQWSPNTDCGSSPVLVRNQATAGLYIYTPYQPNAATLAAGYGTGDGCSAYGNRNFWLYYTDWFGSTQGVDVLPEGSLESVTSADGQYTVNGWAFDRTDPTQSVTAHVYLDGAFAAATTADTSRPDVDTVFGVGSRHGFSVSVPTWLGAHEVCVYLLNVGGSVNPQIGCRVVVNVDAHVPVGTLDTVVAAPGTVTVTGWAYDPDAPSAALPVHVYSDGSAVGSLTTGAARPDVAAAFSVGQSQGFSNSFAVSPGAHRICVYGINLGSGSANPQMGCGNVMVSDPALNNPLGSLDSLSGMAGTIRAVGWAYDPDAPKDPATVHVYVDGSYVKALTADASRPDLDAGFPGIGPSHGFSWQYEPRSAGAHTVCLYAINVSYGTTNPTLGCRTVTTGTPAQANPVGAYDQAQGGAGNVALSGWVFDPDRPTDAASVHVYVDGTFAAAVTADGSRPDVGVAYPGTGDRHGWYWSGPVGAGRHQVCVYAINVGPGTTNPPLGCRSVTVTDPATRNPVGNLDGAALSGGVLSVAGWAFDPDAVGALVHVYVDGVYTGGVATNVARPDVARAFPSAGPTTGFLFSAPMAPGQHQVCAYAINAGPGTSNPPIGCTTVSG